MCWHSNSNPGSNSNGGSRHHGEIEADAVEISALVGQLLVRIEALA